MLASGLTAGAQATLTGLVRDSVGRPLPRAEVLIEARRKSTLSDENGRYRLTDVPTGASLVQARALGYQAVAALVTLASNDTKQSDLTLSRLPATLDTVKVEVYRSASEIPIEYGGPSAICGVMVLWPKRG